MTNRITILGSTGSIGVNTLDVVGQLGEDYAVDALTGNGNVELLARQARDARARMAVTAGKIFIPEVGSSNTMTLERPAKAIATERRLF